MNKEIKYTIEPVEVLQKMHLDYRLKGDELQVRYCPFCNGGRNRETYKFAVNAWTGAYNCRRGKCAEQGSMWQLLEHAGLNPKEYIDRQNNYSTNKTMNKFNNTLSNRVKKSGALIGGEKKTYQQPYTTAIALTLVCLSYLTKFRLIPESTIKDWAIASTPDNNILFRFYEKRGDQFANVYSKQRLAREAQGDEAKTKQDAKTKPILYGSWLVADDAKQLVITEGEIDALTVYSAGIRNVVSMPAGTNNQDWIELQFEWLEKFESIVLWFDADVAGKKAVKEVAMRLGRHRISIVETQHKDANEMLTTLAKTAGVDEALKQIKHAVETASDFPVEDLEPLTKPPSAV